MLGSRGLGDGVPCVDHGQAEEAEEAAEGRVPMKCECGFTYPGEPTEGSSDDIEHRWIWHGPRGICA